MLSLDGDENILLKGRGNYKMFINGRPSALVAHNPTEALKAMPANSVQKIEVITTPPAKYDAEGLAGIINIVTNKRLVDGYNGSIGVSYNDMVGMGENATLTRKKGKFGITSRAYVYQDFKRYLETESSRNVFLPTFTRLLQEGTYSYVGAYSSENLEISFEIDSLSLITASGSLFQSRYDDQTTQISRKYNDQNELLQSYDLLNINPQRETGVDLNINYQLDFKRKKNQLLTFSYQFQDFPNRQSDEVQITNRYNYEQNSYRQANSNGTREQTMQVDYVHPAKIFTIEVGAKVILRNNFSDFGTEIYNKALNAYSADGLMNNSFDYRQSVYSLYNSWHLKLKKIEIKAGFRLENTRINADFITQKSFLKESYTNYIPVISIQRKLNQGAINLGYSQRISRPGIYQLNPFIDKSDPQFITAGNPELEPVLNHNFELAYNIFGKGNCNIALSYSFANNNIQQVTSLLEGGSYTTYENIGENKTAGMNLSISYPFSKSFTGSINSALGYIWMKGGFNKKLYENDGLQGSAYASLNYKINTNWRLGTFVSFISASPMLQGRKNAIINNSFRLTKDLLKKKLTASFSVVNPYQKYWYVKTNIITADFEQRVSGQKIYRTFGLSLKYNFGALKSDIKKNQRSITNDDVGRKVK
ncbi:hypothetical protein AAKU52_001909 [Pedobacter sp. CG_S7]|uniref:outer membrane beta-barrel family protein n=1 Tax=Pedobacter sp. CG_S7 TaxID=3143930 RepID=UPI003394944C